MKLFYNLRRGIHNIIRWIPVIWSDEDFDFQPIYHILYHKFKFMEDFYRSDYTWSANALNVADEIKTVKNLCKRLDEEPYLLNALTEYDKIYGDEPLFDFVPESNGKWLKCVDRDKDQNKMFSKCGKHSDYLQKQDREYLFSELNKHIEFFWD